MGLYFLAALAASVTSGPPAEPAQPPKPSLQQQFDAASEAANSAKCKEAVSLFEQLERDPRFKPESFAGAAAAVRKGNCLVALGQASQGEAAIRSGLPQIRKAGEGFAGDLALGALFLGHAALARNDYADARRNYDEALTILKNKDRLGALSGLAKATAFDGGAISIAAADEALRNLAAEAEPNKNSQAAFHTLRARTLLNQGKNKEAFEDLKQALKLSGGLTLKASLADASLRGDLAIASTLLGRDDDARKYLAYTGQGRMSDATFGSALAMEPPECGIETGLRPEDFAVVEFGIGKDGHVSTAQTIYTRGDATIAAAFSRAVLGWEWHPASLEKIPPFFLASTRVELRCTEGGDRMSSPVAPIIKQLSEWSLSQLDTRGLPKSRPELIDFLIRKRAEMASSGKAEGEIAAIFLLNQSERSVDLESFAMLDQAIALSARSNIPVEISNSLRIYRKRNAWFSRALRETSSERRKLVEVETREWLDLAKEPSIAADALASATVRMIAADPTTRTTKIPPLNVDLLQQVADDTRLPAHHPLRQIALLTLANHAAEQKDFERAEALFRKTGLTEEQCALFAPVPAMRRTGAGSEDFPLAAAAYGFEGWVKLEYDISADGRAQAARPVIAYPPFVFAEAASGMAGGFRFERSYRPAANVACSANSSTINFRLP